MRIGRFTIGIRTCRTSDFLWFYHPLLECNEKPNFVFFVWIGWHLYACMRRKKIIKTNVPETNPPRAPKVLKYTRPASEFTSLKENIYLYYCGWCGMDIRRDDRYCRNCGKKVDWDDRQRENNP